MTATVSHDGAAERLLHNLQRVLLVAAQAVHSEGDDQREITDADRDAIRDAEQSYGAQCTHYGRLLNELVSGSHAWDLFEKSPDHPAGLPRVYEISQCEPLLRIMRESGELAERENLLRGRDMALSSLWLDPSRSEHEQRILADRIHEDYDTAVRKSIARYRANYLQLGASMPPSTAPIAGPRVRSRPFLQPPLIALLYKACHSDKTPLTDFRSVNQEPDALLPAVRGLTVSSSGSEFESLTIEWKHGGNSVQIHSPVPNALDMKAVGSDRDAVRAWAAQKAESDLEMLDEMAWDLAALAMSAFYVRTDGRDVDSSFPLLIDDYFEWRNVDPRKRSATLRAEIAQRLELMCSDRLKVRSDTDLWLMDQETKKRSRTPVVVEGPLLVNRSRFWRKHGGAEPQAGTVPDGYIIALGEWARVFVAERAMLGVCLKRLAEYDLSRQQWERRIGWYLVFQLTNQAGKMKFRDATREGRPCTYVTPQHPLRMATVLIGCNIAWEDIARTNPGKVIRQWCEALENLRKDGVIGAYSCLDGQIDGSDLPVRGRLNAMLKRRYQFIPGRDLLDPLRSKAQSSHRRKSLPARPQ